MRRVLSVQSDKRASSACNTCRSRKVRCSQGHPECQRCSRLHLACSYAQTSIAGESRRTHSSRIRFTPPTANSPGELRSGSYALPPSANSSVGNGTAAIDSPNTAPKGKSVRRRQPPTRLKSCEYCRAHRLRCDRVAIAPRACTTCWERNITCVFAGESKSIAPHSQNESSRAAPVSREDAEPMQSQAPSDHGFQRYDGTPQTIDEVTLQPMQINDHFEYFFRHVHPHFPFLDTPCSISDTSAESPLLFWTIVTIAATHRDRVLYRRLQRSVRRLIPDVLHPARHTMKSCQALCLICMYPFEAEEPSDDPSYLYTGLVSHLALRMGLHRPEFIADFRGSYRNSTSRSLQLLQPHDISNTWYACLFVEYMLSSKIGVPSGIRLDWSTLQRLHRSTGPRTPTVIRNHVLLCATRERYLHMLAHDGHSDSGLTDPKLRLQLIQLCSTALDDFEAASEPLDPLSTILLTDIRMTLAGLCLAEDMQKEISDECKPLIFQGLSAAPTVLDLIAPLPWETLPVHILRAVLYTGTFIAQATRVGFNLSSVAESIAVIERAVDILRHLAYGHDFCTRGKVVLGPELAKLRDTTNIRTRGVALKTRMAANLYWDLVRRERHAHNWTQPTDDIYRELVHANFDQVDSQNSGTA